MRRFALLFPILPVLLVACDPPPPPVPGQLERTGDVVSTVNGQNVTRGMVDAFIEQLPPGTADKIKAQGQMAQVEDQVVIGEVLYQEAIKQKLHETTEGKNAIALAERNALAGQLVEKVVNERTTDAAIQAFYDEHAVQYKRPQVKARHILVKEKAEADAILAQLKGGADFAKLATEKSLDPGSGKEGGDLGWFEKGRMVPEFADAAFVAEKGSTIGPIQTKFGYHVIMVEDKREGKPIEEVKDQIKQQLQKDLVDKYIEEIKKTATIVTPTAAGAPGASVTESKPAPGAAPAGAPPGGLKLDVAPAGGDKPAAAPH